MVSPIARELLDIASRVAAPGARKALRPFLRVYLPSALYSGHSVRSELSQSDLWMLCDMADLSLVELEQRYSQGIPHVDVCIWETLGHHLLEKSYPGIASCSIVKLPPDAPVKVYADSDRIRTLIDICVDYADYARAVVYKDIVCCGSDRGTVSVRRHSAAKPETLLNCSVSVAPIRDLALSPRAANLFYLDDLGQFASCALNGDTTLISVDPHARRMSMLASRSRLILASPARGLTVWDATGDVKSLPVVAKWKTFAARLVDTPSSEPHIFASADANSVRLLDLRDRHVASESFIGPRSLPTALSVSKKSVNSAGESYTVLANTVSVTCAESTYVWDVRRPGEAVFKLKIPGDFPLGPARGEAILQRPNVLMHTRGDTIFTHSLLDGTLLTSTRQVGHRILALFPYEPPVAQSSRLDPHSMMISVSVRRPLITNNESWNIF
jgi:hypothetical protein